MTRQANGGASQHRAGAGGAAQHADRRAGALERITVGRWRTRAGAVAALVCAAWAQTALPASDLPDLGDPSTSALSVLEEKRLGQQFMRQRLRIASIIARFGPADARLNPGPSLETASP